MLANTIILQKDRPNVPSDHRNIEVICPIIATSKNEANNFGVDREQCICLFSDCDAAPHSETDQPGERREAGKARGDNKQDKFL